MEIPYTVERRPDTGVNNVALGMWLFLASEAMLFGGLFSAYALLRAGSDAWPRGAHELSVPLGAVNTVVLLAASAALAWATRAPHSVSRARALLAASAALGCVFLGIKGTEYAAKFAQGTFPSTNTFYAVYFLLTGVHALHMVGGVAASAYLAAAGVSSTHGNVAQFTNRVSATALYWYFVDLVWIAVFVSLYIV